MNHCGLNGMNIWKEFRKQRSESTSSLCHRYLHFLSRKILNVAVHTAALNFQTSYSTYLSANIT